MPPEDQTPDQDNPQILVPSPDPRRADDDEVLRDAGRRALDAERKAKADAERRAKALEAELAKLQEMHASDAEKAILQAKREGRAEAEAEYKSMLDRADQALRQERVLSAIRAEAATRLTNADDAMVFYRAGEHADRITTDEDGKVVGVKDWLDRVTKDRPYLLRDAAPRETYGSPAPARNGNPGSGRTSIEQLTEQMRQSGMGVRI